MVDRQIKLLKALSDETRFKIVQFLLDGKKSVTDITNFTKKAQPTVSLQLRVLSLSGIVKAKKDGRAVFYQVSNKNVFRLMEVLKAKK